MKTSPRAASGVATEGRPALVGAELVQVMNEAFDRDALERQLLTFAVHAEGLGARGAWLLVRQRDSATFVTRGSAIAAPEPQPLAVALRAPGMPVSAAVPAGPIAEDELETPLAGAWTRGTPAAAPLDAGDHPWSDSLTGALPLRVAFRPYALLVVAWEGGEPAERSAQLVALHRLALGAAETQQRALETRRRARQADAIQELARLSASSSNLAEALRLVARIAAHATAARGSALWLADAGGAARLEATHGPAGRREGIARGLESAARGICAGGRAALYAEGDDFPALAGEALGLGSLALMPLEAYGRVHGVLAVYDRIAMHPSESAAFDAVDAAFLATIADLLAMLVDAAHASDALRATERRVQELVRRIEILERRAATGARAAARLAEARPPLSSIVAFTRRIERALAEDDPQRAYLEIVRREAERLERMCEPPEPATNDETLTVASVNGALQEVLQETGERLVRRRVRLLKRLAPDLPQLLIDDSALRRTLRNIVGHALDRVVVGGRIRVESRRGPDHVIVDIAHDGPRRNGELLEELFAPFAERPAEVLEPGIALARRIVREHGGEVRLRSEGEWTAIVSLTLPIAENRDRRAGRERRATKADRRAGAVPR